MDAHSWVEVFFPGIGWVTRDPTPGDAPARSQTSDVASTGPGVAAAAARRGAPTPGPAPAPGRRRRGRAGAAQDELVARRVAAIVLGLAAVLAAAAARARRAPRAGARRAAATTAAPAQLAELRRALRRSGRPASPQTTLEALARRWHGTPAEGYVRVLAAARYGYGDGRPTPAQRAALRRELAAGGGVRGRVRAWWALPPRPGRPRR